MNAMPMPHNEYAEQTAIGCLLEGYQPETILAELVSDDFYAAGNRLIFATARDLHDAGTPVGMFTIIDRLKSDGNLDKAGGQGYLERCANMVVSHTQAEGAVWGVRDAALLRKGYLVTAQASREFTGAGVSATELIGDLQSKLLAITARDKVVAALPAKVVVQEAVQKIDSYQDKTGVTGVPTGFRLLDYWTAGLQPGELIILAARPSMGKTSLMMQASVHAAMQKRRVYVFSLEMSREQLALRMICSDAQIDSHIVRTGRTTPAQRSMLAQSASKLGDARMIINDGASDLNEIIAAAKREHAIVPLDLVCIDYLGLIYNRSFRTENRNNEIGIMTRQLKAMAKDLHLPVLCLSQLSRINEASKEKRPTLNALRESGNIEQDADTVLFIHSDDYYNRESAGGVQAQEWKSEIIIAKQRNGPTEEIPVQFRRQFTRFYEIDQREPAPAETPGWYSN